MKKVAISILLAFTVLSLEAQNEVQALRYSTYNPFGTARYAAQGGAIGALGGDFSSVYSNPAGLGFYRSSEFSFTPSLYQVNTTTDFQNNLSSDSRLKFNIGSLGFVGAKVFDKKNGFVQVSYALGYNTLANFNQRSSMRGINNSNSLLDDFTWHANSGTYSPFYEELAFETSLMPYDEVEELYWHDMQIDGYGQQVYRQSEITGYIGEYSFSGAFNFSNLLYFGATFGIHAVRFNEDILHMETDYDNHVLDFSEFRFREYNSTRGTGYTGRFGLILRPMQVIRIGATVHLPTYYSLTDEKINLMNSYWDNTSSIEDASAESPNGIFDYKLQTPMRASLNASVILFRFATISAGYEYVDYTASRYDTNYEVDFIMVNDDINQAFQVTHNLKAGAEFRFSNLYLRAGSQYLMSPYLDTRNDAYTMVYSGGLGLRTKGYYFDMSYTYGNTNQVYSLYEYEPGLNEISFNELRAHNMMFTLGFKF